MSNNNDIATQLREDIASANASPLHDAIEVLGSMIGGPDQNTVVMFHESFADMQFHAHALARVSGWWEEYDAMPLVSRKHFIAGKMALVHSEVSEGLEGFRKSLMDDHLPHRPMVEVEMADAIIRILDLAGALNLDVAGALIEKLAYNQRRPDHKPEARAAEGGKSL